MMTPIDPEELGSLDIQLGRTKLYSINLRIRNVVLFIHILSSNQINDASIEIEPTKIRVCLSTYNTESFIRVLI